jgi:hypothetical protein
MMMNWELVSQDRVTATLYWGIVPQDSVYIALLIIRQLKMEGWGWEGTQHVERSSQLVLHVINRVFQVHEFSYNYFVTGKTNKANFSVLDDIQTLRYAHRLYNMRKDYNMCTGSTICAQALQYNVCTGSTICAQALRYNVCTGSTICAQALQYNMCTGSTICAQALQYNMCTGSIKCLHRSTVQYEQRLYHMRIGSTICAQILQYVDRSTIVCIKFYNVIAGSAIL